MNKNKVKEIEMGNDYLISNALENIDFVDHYQLSTKQLHYAPEPKDLMIAFFKSFPKSFMYLLILREKIANFFNLKTAEKLDEQSRIEQLHNFKGNIGDSIAIFHVLEKNEEEILTGEDDSHLNFRLSFITYKDDDAINLEMATTVDINNRLGKIYFAIVKPIHKYYMKQILRKMEVELLNKVW